MLLRSILATLAVCVSSVAIAAGTIPTPADNDAFLAQNARKPGVTILPGNVQYDVVSNGDPTGDHPAPTDCARVKYSVALIDGPAIQTSPASGIPVRVNGVIGGWTEVLQKMRIGDDWHVVIPSAMAYGKLGKPPSIPPNQTLVFDIQLLDIFTSYKPNCVG